MQAFSVAFGRVSRATFSSNPELKNYISDLVNRAYFNLHGVALAMAEPAWAAAITAAAVQLCLDERVHQLSVRELVHLFENIIRVSEEHLREARRHAAMANNVFYLKETALDAILTEHAASPDMAEAAPTVVALGAHGGRLAAKKTEDSAA